MDEQRNPLKSELKFLERLSIEELEALLKFSGDPDDVEMLFDTVVEEVVAREEKNPTGRLPDVNAAWDELQIMYHDTVEREPLPEEKAAALDVLSGGMQAEKEPSKRVSLRRAARVAAVMAAAMALSLALMVGAQAAGADVFGALARWTDETFHFETWSAEPTYCEALYNDIKEIFDNQGIIGAYVPTWFPEGFTITSTMATEDKLGTSIRILLSNEHEGSIGISVDQYKEKNFIDPQTFEIETDSVEKYTSNNKMYYIFSNNGSVTASWSDGSVLQRIWGDLTISEIESILDSVGVK